jgi:hypothetical protein
MTHSMDVVVELVTVAALALEFVAVKILVAVVVAVAGVVCFAGVGGRPP